jgi:CxxC motif-containing protein (DUF1111 family)
MHRSPFRLLALPLAPALVACLSACDAPPRFTEPEPGEERSAGQATVKRQDRQAYSLPSATLPREQRLDFSVGNSFFRSPWVIAPSSTTARDGLGPLFNTNACQNCHIRDGRGHPPGPDALNAVSMLVRLSIAPATGEQALLERIGVVPEPTYGTQLQDMAIPGVQPEGKVRVEYSAIEVRFDDGYRVQLRQPQLQISQLGYGPLHPRTQMSARVAPPMIGLGLLEAIPEAAILANAKAQAAQGNGVQGRVNRVWDDTQGATVLGRFGWKAGQPSLMQQNAHAFAGDMGLTSRLKPVDDCSPAQTACQAATNGNGNGSNETNGELEVSDNILRLVQFYTRHLGVPERRDVAAPKVIAGKNLFYQAGCQSCHVPQYITATDGDDRALAGQVIRPYTDLLLHDMGPGLADGRPEFLAGPRDWRTPPLWGIGLSETVSGHSQFLHDGRARNLLEAVLWHGGEAEPAKRHVLTFNAEQRDALLAFLNSL